MPRSIPVVSAPRFEAVAGEVPPGKAGLDGVRLTMMATERGERGFADLGEGRGDTLGGPFRVSAVDGISPRAGSLPRPRAPSRAGSQMRRNTRASVMPAASLAFSARTGHSSVGP